MKQLDDRDAITRILSSKNLHKEYYFSKKKLKEYHNKQSQKWFLNQCLKLGMIPPTFQINNKPCNSHSKEAQSQWKLHLDKSSRDLMEIAIIELTNLIENIRSELEKSKETLFSSLEETELFLINDDLMSHECKCFKIVLESKKKKITHLTEKGSDVKNSRPILEEKSTKKKKNRPGINKRKYLKKLHKRQKKAHIDVVFNFSSQIIDPPTQRLLNRGLSFAVKTLAPTRSEIKADCKKFSRRVLFTERFHDSQNQNYTPPLFKTDKSNLPVGPSPRYLTAFLNATETNLCDKTNWNKKLLNPKIRNIPDDEYKALLNLRKLQNDRIITIKPADKGSGICIIDYQDYVESCNIHLNSTQPQENSLPPLPYYSPANENLIKKAKKEILSVLEEGKKEGWLTNPEFKAMDPSDCRIGKFYQIFKVHKSYSEGSLPPSRPIINGMGSLTEKISKYVDHHTRSLVQKLPTYIEDTRDFLQALEEENEIGGIPNDAILVTIDVSALYTNIKKEDAIEAMKQALEDREDKSIPSHFILELLRLIFTCNFFEFGPNIYKQDIGTAMGTPSGPSIASITVGKLIDPKFLELASKVYSGPGDPIRRLKRFLDDFFMIWMGDIESLELFLERINSLHPTLKFTSAYTCPFVCTFPQGVQHDCFCYTSRSIPFLDTLVSIRDEKLITDLYRKPTDRCQYLLPSSCHPPHVINNIPYSLAHRLVRICSEKPTLEKRFDELKNFLLSRQYDIRLIDSAISKAKTLDREQALRKVERETTKRPVFVTTYHPALPPVAKILKNNWRVMIESDNHLKNVFPQPPMVAFKQPRNSSLRQILVKSTLPGREQRLLPGLKKCRNVACSTCPFIKEGPKIVCSQNRKVNTHLHEQVNCETENLVYIITCEKPQCNFIQYVGETKRSLKTRFAEHLGYVRRLDQTSPTGQHFTLPGHNESNMILQVLEKCKFKSTHYRLTREAYYINLYDTVRNGLNKKM